MSSIPAIYFRKQYKYSIRTALSFIAIFIISIYCYTRMGIGNLIPFSVHFTFVLGALLVFIFSNAKKPFRVTKIDLLVLTMICIMLFWNNWDLKNGAINNLFNMSVLFVFYIFSSKSWQWVDSFCKITIGAGVFYAVWTLICWSSPDIYLNRILPIMEQFSISNLRWQYEKGYMVGLTAHYSTNALYISSGICFTIGYYFFIERFNGEKIKPISCLLLGIQVFALLLTGKRAPVIYIILAFVVTYIFYNTKKSITKYFRLFAMAIGILVVFLISVRYVPELANFIVRFQISIDAGNVTSYRFQLWTDALFAFIKHPFFGNGWFWYRYHNYFNSTSYHVHNCFLQWLCELGIMGAFPFFVFVGIKMIQSIISLIKIRSRRIMPNNDYYRSIYIEKMLVIVCMYMVFFLLMSFTGTAFFEAQSLFPYLGICSILQLCIKDKRQGRL